VECSILLSEALMQRHDVRASQELDRALLRSDKLGTKPLSTRARFLLAGIAANSGQNSEAQDHYRGTVQLLDGIRKEPGAEKILDRSDFKAMYEEARRKSQAAKS
jgi:hypothetical protein